MKPSERTQLQVSALEILEVFPYGPHYTVNQNRALASLRSAVENEMKMKQYLLGWSAGATNGNYDFPIEKKVKRRAILGGGPAVSFNETVIFKTKEKAVKAISEQQKYPGSRRYVRGHILESNKPQPYPLFNEKEHGNHFIDPE